MKTCKKDAEKRDKIGNAKTSNRNIGGYSDMKVLKDREFIN